MQTWITIFEAIRLFSSVVIIIVNANYKNFFFLFPAFFIDTHFKYKRAACTWLVYGRFTTKRKKYQTLSLQNHFSPYATSMIILISTSGLNIKSNYALNIRGQCNIVGYRSNMFAWANKASCLPRA